MCRWSKRLTSSGLGLVLFVLLVLGARPARASDDVAAYLERHGLTELLAVHLERRLETVDGEEREAMLVRLASLYAQLLETVTDPARRLELAGRSRHLLETAPKGATDELHLALLRATYRSAERTAENHRLRLTTPEELAAVRESMAALVGDLVALRRETDTATEVAERRLARATGGQAMVLAEEAERARQLHKQTTFLNAWAFYYHAWLHDRPAGARNAERLFAELLDLNDQATTNEVTVDLRSTEAIARCILGMALCKGMTVSSVTALEWVRLLEHERTYAPLREQTDAWQIAILLEDGEFLNARAVLDRAGADGPVPLHWLRLAAVHAIEAGRTSRHAMELAKHAVTELAARGELEQVFDLAERYGVDALATTGFALRYVNGILEYHAARALHGSDGPSSRDDVAARYEDAITQFETAVAAPDASNYPSALPDCTRLIAWCRYFRGELVAASGAFEEAAATLAADAAPEALWMAIVCVDRLVEADPRNTALADRLAGLVDRFLAEYPSSEHAPKLVLRRAIKSTDVSPELVDDLLAIPANSEVYDAARRRASQLLYRLFRDTRGLERVGYGNQYLLVALPLHVADAEQVDPAEALAFERFIVRGRRILEVALHEGIGRLVAARAVLGAFEDLGAGGAPAVATIADELAYRRVQERLISGDVPASVGVADDLAVRAPASVWTRLADRALFRFAQRRWKEVGPARGDDRLALAMVIKYGTRVLAETKDDPEALEKSTMLGAAVAVAEASFLVWERSREAATGRLALELYERLLAFRPRNARFLRATALLSQTLEKPDQAVECWRTLVAGSAQGTNAWFEAKFNLISLLAKTDPTRARAVLDQHRSLNPDYGPDPWGPRLRMLDQRIPIAETPAVGTGSSRGTSTTGGRAGERIVDRAAVGRAAVGRSERAAA